MFLSILQVGSRLMTATLKYMTSSATSPIHLHLNQCHLTDTQMEEMFRKTWPARCLLRIRTLQLARNSITWKGVRCLASAIPQLTSLHQLNLNENKIRDKGAQALSRDLGASHLRHTYVTLTPHSRR